ncbi:MAG: sigma-70 family RNA polymerase sigma factor [Deltaproteobacteria bacterium]|nr:sigma-70 family RNA polymerase sigma factor [Deltaproteobacteria bacterium]
MAGGEKSKIGEREKFSHEAVTYLDHLYRVALYLVKESDQAQDFVQETYVRALGSYEQFTPGSNMKAWLTRILNNFFVDNFHRRKRWVSASLVNSNESEAEYWESVPADNPGPEGEILLKELDSKITDALKKIPEEYRMPIILVDMGDFSYAETAEVLSCPVGTVRSRLSRGRSMLHTLLRGYIDQNEKARKEK